MTEQSPERPQLVSAFMTGFVMGLSAPALLLTSTLGRAQPNVSEALAGDWKRVGDDMRAAFKRIRRPRH